MNGKQSKALRGQVRQIVQELLPEVLTNELIAAVAKQLHKEVKGRLDQIDQRQKDITGYIVRNSAGITPAQK